MSDTVTALPRRRDLPGHSAECNDTFAAFQAATARTVDDLSDEVAVEVVQSLAAFLSSSCPVCDDPMGLFRRGGSDA